MNKKKNIIQLVFWSLLFILTNRLMSLNTTNSQTFILSSGIVFSLAGISYLNALILVPKLLTRKKHLLYTLVILGILILMSSLFVRLDLTPILPPKREMPPGIDKPLFFHPKFVLIFFINSLFVFVSTIIRLSLDFAQKEQQRIQSEKERLLIETQYLRSQMNPHFFLNALNNLQYIHRFLPQQSEKYINTLAEMMRYVTYDCKNDKIQIEKEVEYIKNYIYFQQVKDDEIIVDLQTNIQDKETPIEPMLLMPFVENAFKYGIVEDTKNHPISISIKQDKKVIYFCCKNSINHTTQTNTDPSYSGLGIQNVKDRLNVSYPNNYDLQIVNNDVSFTVELKIITP